MPKIGVILAGAASKGAYEFGCIRAIEEYFGSDSICCVSSASIGTLVAQAHGRGRTEEIMDVWRNINPKEHGRFFLTYSGDEEILRVVRETITDRDPLRYEHYTSVWNYTQSKVDYIPLHTMSGEKLSQYILGAIAIPFFSKGEVIDGDLIIDGAFLDNIPVFPLLEKDLDYIFCVYFDNCRYFFENEAFDRKVIKLYDFPNDRMLELMTFRPQDFDSMVQYGYEYTLRTIREIFEGPYADVYEGIAQREAHMETTYKPRLTADIVLNNINVMTKRYSGRLTNRIRKRSEE